MPLSVDVRSSRFAAPTSSLECIPCRCAEFGFNVPLLVGAGVPEVPDACGEDEAREPSNEYALCGEVRRAVGTTL